MDRPPVQIMGNKEEGQTKMLDHLKPHPSYLVKQTRRGWLQECFGCEAKTEFNIATIEQPENNILYSLEDSSCFCRVFFKAIRPYQQTISLGSVAGGPTLVHLDRPVRCKPSPCQCCCHQELRISDGNGRSLGLSILPFYWCVPNVVVQDEGGRPLFHVHQPTCWKGMCVDCCAEGCCNCKIPFYIYDPARDEPEKQIGKIIKIWRGLGVEMFTDADTFQVQLPPDASVEDKARLLATTIMINSLFFETNE